MKISCSVTAYEVVTPIQDPYFCCVVDILDSSTVQMEVNTVVKLGNLFMSFLFAYSASVQLNDTDWYFWFPFYSSASLISLIHGTEKARYPLWSILNLCFGLLLLIKVIIEAAPMTAILSLDMNERVVREKCGSFLVISTMGLQIQSMLNGKERERFNAIGICCIVLLSIGLCSKYFLA